MKYLETTYDEYIKSVEKQNIHVKFENIYNNLSDDFTSLKHMIFYGPSGIGKYSQMLYCIKRYSSHNMRYDKRFNVEFNKKKDYVFRMSDIHYEVDMELLGCNSRLLWINVYNQIVDIIQAKKDRKYGFIVCKNFHTINGELLEIFYSYMQYKNNSIKFILLTEHITFIPTNIINSCQLLSFSRPTKKQYFEITDNKDVLKTNISEISNIKNTKNDVTQLKKHHVIICNTIIKTLRSFTNNYSELREQLYNILIYKLDVYKCVWYIYTSLIKQFDLSESVIFDINIEMHKFFKYYNNNYRPIYHLERIMLYIVSKSNGS